MTHFHVPLKISTGLALLPIFGVGCSSALKPSLAERNHAYGEVSPQAQKDTRHFTTATFYLLTADWEIDPSEFRNPRAHPNLLSHGKAGGLAFAIDERGYLLTASHCVGEHMYLLGVLNGKATVLRPTVVARALPKVGAEYALLHVDEPLTEHLELGGKVAIGDNVSAVLLDWNHRKPLEIAGGVVTAIRQLPQNEKVGVIESSIPTWHGDSGGPLLDSEGRAIGINTAGVWNIGLRGLSVFHISAQIDANEIKHLVEQDAGRRASSQSPEATRSAGMPAAGQPARQPALLPRL